MKLLVKIGENTFPINDLGKSMNSQFLGFYESHFSGRAFDFTKFREEAFKFFDQNYSNNGACDGFFNNFTVIWPPFLNQRRFKKAEELWNLALNIAYEWETKNPGKRIHKGTPYYFWGVTCILNEDLEKGFLSMHQALEEDKNSFQSNTPKAPAYYFVTLDYKKQDQFFKSKVQEIADFVDGKLHIYRSLRNGTLTLTDFKSRFLEEPNLQKVVFYYVFEAFHLKKLADIDKKLTQNVFSSLLESKIIFGLCLIVDNVLKEKNPSEWKFFDHLKFLSSKSSLRLDNEKLSEVGNAFKNNFSSTLQSFLSSQYRFQDGTMPKSIEEDLAITYGFRNFGAHKIEAQPIIYRNFKEISQRILNALFFSAEKLY